MKRKLTLALLLLLAISLFGPALTVQAVDYRDFDSHAPYFINEWVSDSIFDAVTVDWFCEENASGTYWATLDWVIINPLDPSWEAGGYAGFQTRLDRPKILMSCWDADNGTRPLIEYASEGPYGSFGNEGTGKQIYTDFRWQPKTWYTMRIQARDGKNKTYFEQWVKQKGGQWKLTAMASYPIRGLRIRYVSGFQEDFEFNNSKRKQRVKNFYGRNTYTHLWESVATQFLTNWYYEPDDDFEVLENKFDLDDVTFNCDWGVKDDYLWIETGGADDFAVNGKSLPAYFTLQQPPLPEDDRFLNYKDHKHKMEVVGVPQVDISWKGADEHSYKILTTDFKNCKDCVYTDFNIFEWHFGTLRLAYGTKDITNVQMDLYTFEGDIVPEVVYLNPNHSNGVFERSWGVTASVGYPLQKNVWYTHRLQIWEKKDYTYIGHWMHSQENDWELMFIARYQVEDLAMYNPRFSFRADKRDNHIREFRLKNTYGRVAGEKNWQHWNRYTVQNHFNFKGGSAYYYDNTAYNVENNIQTGRHKNGYVWVRVGGKKFKNYDRYYPFTFRIKGEKDKPANPTFVLTDIPKKYRP